MPQRNNGVQIALHPGTAVAYALWSLEERGEILIRPGDPVYEGMIIGVNNKGSDLVVNAIKEKKLTNMRSSGADDAIQLTPPREMTLEFALEFIEDDELVEVTPKSIRLRKKILNDQERKVAAKRPATV
jgi:GTP-binding protein